MSRSADSGGTRAAIYCRISLARHGDTVKVDDQERLCRKVAEQRGWTVADHHVFKDNSVSAWQHGVRRPGWESMLAAVEQGQLDAIIVYHGDRLIRAPFDLEVLLNLARDRGIRLASPVGERSLDNTDDQFILRIEAAAQHREVAATSRRLRAHFDRQAEKGIVRLGGRGGRAFGFEPDGRTVRQSDAAMIREAAERVLAGEGVGAICRDLTARGFRTSAGNGWDHGALRKLLLRPRIAGLLPESRGMRPAAWPEILDRQTWEAVRSVLLHKAEGFAYATNLRRYLLSGLALCGPCGESLAIRHTTRSESLRGYGCINPACVRKVHRNVRHLDAYVEGHVVEMLADTRLRARMQPAAPAGQVVKLATLEERRDGLLAAFAEDDEVGAEVIRGTIGPLNRRIEALRVEVASARTAHALDDFWGVDLAGWRRVGAAPGGLARQRAVVAALLRVTVHPSGRRGPGFDPSSVEVSPRG